MRKKELVRACKIFVTAPKWGLPLPELSRGLQTTPDDLSVFSKLSWKRVYPVVRGHTAFREIRPREVQSCWPRSLPGMFYLQQGVSVLSSVRVRPHIQEVTLPNREPSPPRNRWLSFSSAIQADNGYVKDGRKSWCREGGSNPQGP